MGTPCLALAGYKCQSSEVTHIHVDDGTIRVIGDRQQLIYAPLLLSVADLEGNIELTVAHESRQADLTIASVWATDLGDCYVEAMYPGDGPEGGELVVIVPAENAIIVGDLAADGTASNDWAAALDLALALTNAQTIVYTTQGQLPREELDDAHQNMLRKLLG